MIWKLIAWIGLAAVAVAATGIVIASARNDRANRALASGLLQAAEPVAEAEAGRRAGLPAPVQRYLARALPTDETPKSARLEQRGEMQLQGQWRPFTAVQHVTAQPPGFVWDARMTFAPLVSARVVDAYRGGAGVLRAKLLGAIAVADAGSSRALDVSELMRYVAEGPWLPTAWLPRDGLGWEALGERSARMTLTDGAAVATIDVFFDEAGDVVRIEGDRPKDVGAGDPELGRWVGLFSGYVEQDGVRYPSEGEVGWVGEDGFEPYWRGKITSATFDPE